METAPFNRRLDARLLRLVRAHPALYDPRDPRYCDGDARELAWQRIGDALARPPQRCKSRWLNIRDMMRRTLRNRQRYPDQYLRKYRYEQELSFMLPFYKLSNTNIDPYLENTELEIPPSLAEDLNFDVKPLRKRNEEATSGGDFESALSPTDPLDVFLMTIGSTMRKFSPYYMNQAKSRIFQICQDYELQQIVNREGQELASSSGHG